MCVARGAECARVDEGARREGGLEGGQRADASSSVSRSQPEGSGETKPEAASARLTVTCAPQGTFSVRVRMTASSAAFASTRGGVLKDRRSEVLDRSTLPALSQGGRPSAPTTHMEGFQVFVSRASKAVSA